MGRGKTIDLDEIKLRCGSIWQNLVYRSWQTSLMLYFGRQRCQMSGSGVLWHPSRKIKVMPKVLVPIVVLNFLVIQWNSENEKGREYFSESIQFYAWKIDDWANLSHSLYNREIIFICCLQILKRLIIVYMRLFGYLEAEEVSWVYICILK